MDFDSYYVICDNFKTVYKTPMSGEKAFSVKDVEYAVGLGQPHNSKSSKIEVQIFNDKKLPLSYLIYRNWEMRFNVWTDQERNYLMSTMFDGNNQSFTVKTGCDSYGFNLAIDRFKEYSQHNSLRDLDLSVKLKDLEGFYENLSTRNKANLNTIIDLTTELTQKTSLIKSLEDENKKLSLKITKIKKLINSRK